MPSLDEMTADRVARRNAELLAERKLAAADERNRRRYDAAERIVDEHLRSQHGISIGYIGNTCYPESWPSWDKLDCEDCGRALGADGLCWVCGWELFG